MRRTAAKRIHRDFLQQVVRRWDHVVGSLTQLASQDRATIAAICDAARQPQDFDWVAPENLSLTLVWLMELDQLSRHSEITEGRDWKAVFSFVQDAVPNVWKPTLRQSMLVGTCLGWERESLVPAAAVSALRQLFSDMDPLEWFLNTVRPGKRKDLRYFATPAKIVSCMIDLVHQQLSRQGMDLWHNSDESTCLIVDPAAGSGRFPRGLLRHFLAATDEREMAPDFDRSAWVDRHFLRRMLAVDKEPLAALTGSLWMARDIQQRCGSLDRITPWSIQMGDALVTLRDCQDVAVVIGNPPYGALTTEASPWMQSLLDGTVDGVRYRSQPTGRSQKHWLHDDYIQFIRLGHYLIRQNGWGVLSLVTNRTFLESRGCQAMRQSLARDFSEIQLVDVQRSAREEPPADGNERVFPIGTGVAIGVWGRSKSASDNQNPTVRFRYHRLGQSSSILPGDGRQPIPWQEWESIPDKDQWVPVQIDTTVQRAYESGTPLDEIFQQSWSAIVTARDRVVIDTVRSRLIERLAQLADPDNRTEELRQRWFCHTRSKRYPPGDTRSWRLEEARQKIGMTEWRNDIVACLYRPMDPRWLYFSTDWIDWPRRQDVQSLMRDGNVGLVTRRTAPPGRQYRYAAVSQLPVVDGILRSDNRGNEMVFNLYGRDGKPNLHQSLVQRLAKSLRLRWVGKCLAADRASVWQQDNPLLVQAFRNGELWPEMILAWCYVPLCDPKFQLRFAECLRQGFPRIGLPDQTEQAERSLLSGHQRIAIELEGQRGEPRRLPQETITREGLRWQGGDFQLQRRQIGYDEATGCVRINAESHFGPVPEAVWEFRQGAFGVLEKFLKDRSGDCLRTRHHTRLVVLLHRIRQVVEWEAEQASL